MSTINPNAVLPPTTSTKPTASAQSGGFEILLQNITRISRPTSLETLSDYLTSDEGGLALQDINIQAQNAVKRINTTLKRLLEGQNIDMSVPIIIEIDDNGLVSVGDNPNKTRIIQLLNENPELTQAIHQAASLQKRAALIDMYEAYLEAYYKAYAKGGAKAAREVTEKYFALTTDFTFNFDGANGFKTMINARSVKEFLEKIANELYPEEPEDQPPPRRSAA